MDESSLINMMAPPAEEPVQSRKRKKGSCRREFTRGKQRKTSDQSNQKRCEGTESSNGLDGVVNASDASRTQPHQELDERQPSDPPNDNNFMTTAPIEVIEDATQLHLWKGKGLYYTVSGFYEFSLLSPPEEDWLVAGEQ